MGVCRVVVKGERFGKLRVIKELSRAKPDSCGKRRRMFLFKCDCGNKTQVSLSGVVTGNTVSCGCYGTQRRKEAQTTHGLSYKIDRKLFQVWLDMHSRCYNKNCDAYPAYGGRGIKISKKWHRNNSKGLENFVNWANTTGYKRGLQIDRQNNEHSYTPKNSRWVSHVDNNRNKRNTIIITHPKTGKEIKLIDYYEEKPRKVSYNTFGARYHRGWSIDMLDTRI